AVVDTGGTAVGEDYVDLCNPSGVVSAGFLGRNPDCMRVAGRKFGDAGLAARPREDPEYLGSERACFGVQPDRGGMVADLASRVFSRTRKGRLGRSSSPPFLF